MSKLTIYDSEYNQVEPASEDNKQATGRLRAIIQNSVDLYVDFGNGKVISHFRAKSLAESNTRPENFHAEYLADENNAILDELTTQLQQLESDDGRGDHEWELLAPDGRFNLIWSLSEFSDKSLVDMGLSPRKQLALKKLFEQGHKLDFGVRNYEEAAVAVNYLSRHFKSSGTITVTRHGRIKSIEDVNFVLTPNVNGCFEPLNDHTRSSLRKKETQIENEVRKIYEKRMFDALDDLTCSNRLTTWSLYQDISALETYVDSLWGEEIKHGELRDESTEEIAKLATIVRRGGQVDALPDTDVLDKAAKEKLHSKILEQIRQEKIKLKEEMPERVKSEFVDAVNDLMTERPPTAYRGLLTTLDIIKGERESVGASDIEPVQRIVNYSKELWENRILSAQEKNEIQEAIQHQVSTKVEQLKEQRRQKYLNRFEHEIQYIEVEDVQSRPDLISKVRDIIEDTSVNLGSEVDAYWRFESIISDLENDTILDTNDENEIKSNYHHQLSDRLSELQEKQESYLREKLFGYLDEIGSKSRRSDQLDNAYKKLDLTKQLIISGSLNDMENRDDLRIVNIVQELNRDNVINDDQANEIKQEAEELITNRIDQIRGTKRGNIQQKITNELEKAVEESTQNHGPEWAFKKLEKIEDYLDSPNKDKKVSHQERFGRICTLIDEIHGVQSEVQIFGYHERNAIKRKIRELITEHKSELRDDRQKRLETQFESATRELVESPMIEPKMKVKVFDHLLQYLSDRKNWDKDGLRDLKIDSEDTTNDKLQDIYEEVVFSVASWTEDEPSTILTESQQRELRDHCMAITKEWLNESKGMYIESFSSKINREIKVKTIGSSTTRKEDINSLEDDVRFLETCKKALEKKEQPTDDVFDPDLKAILEEIIHNDYLSPEDYNKIKSETVSFIRERITTVREIERELLTDEFRSEMERIQDMGDQPFERLRILNQMERLLMVDESTDFSTELIPERLLVAPAVLSREELDKLRDDLKNHEKAVFENLKHEWVEDIGDDLSKYVEKSQNPDTTNIQLESFREYIDGESMETSDEHLKRAKCRFERLRQANKDGILDDDIIDSTVEKLGRKIEKLKIETSDNGDSRQSEDSRSGITLGLEVLYSYVDDNRTNIFIIGLLCLLFIGGLLIAGPVYVNPDKGSGDPGPSDPPNAATGPAETPIDSSAPSIDEVIIAQSKEDPSNVEINGIVSGNASEVRLQFEGPDTNETKKVDVIDGSFNTTFRGNGPGVYSISVVASNGSKSSSEVTAQLSLVPSQPPTIEVHSPKWNESFSNDTVLVEADIRADWYSISLHNESGHIIQSQTGSDANGTIQARLQVEENGTYYVIISAAKHNTTSKLIKIEAIHEGSSSNSSNMSSDDQDNRTALRRIYINYPKESGETAQEEMLTVARPIRSRIITVGPE